MCHQFTKEKGDEMNETDARKFLEKRTYHLLECGIFEHTDKGQQDDMVTYSDALSAIAIAEENAKDIHVKGDLIVNSEKQIEQAKAEERKYWKRIVNLKPPAIIDLEAIEKASQETAKEILLEFDTKFYFRFPKGKPPRVDMPKKWYDDMKIKYLKTKEAKKK